MILEAARSKGFAPEVVAEALDPKSLELILLPTEKCNFRCTYCYEDFTIGKMKPWLRQAITSLIESRAPNLDRFSISWFGGEPLLALDVIEEICEKALSCCDSYGVDFRGGLTTNGYLLDEPTLERLTALRQAHFQITLDGERIQHDTTRRRADGRGTFDQIWNNLLRAHRSSLDFAISLRLHISSANLGSQERLVDHLNDYLGGDERFSIHFHRISNLGGPNSGAINVMSMSDYRAALSRLKGKAQFSSNSEVDLVESKGICYAAKANSLLIRADGRVGKCTVALDDPRNTIGAMRPDGTMDISNDLFRLWLNGFRDFDSEALGCPLSSLTIRTIEKPNLRVIASSLQSA